MLKSSSYWRIYIIDYSINDAELNSSDIKNGSIRETDCIEPPSREEACVKNSVSQYKDGNFITSTKENRFKVILNIDKNK